MLSTGKVYSPTVAGNGVSEYYGVIRSSRLLRSITINDVAKGTDHGLTIVDTTKPFPVFYSTHPVTMAEYSRIDRQYSITILFVSSFL